MGALALAALPPCALLAIAVAQGLFVSTAAAAAACPDRVGFAAADAERATADALAAALDVRGVADRGATWVGKLAAVGHGRRDTIIHVPATLDRTRPIELVVFMDGFGSFAERTMESRHAAAIAALGERGANAVYVAPDAPSSRFGDPTSARAYWRAGCADRACGGGHAAPGDFVALYRAVIAHVDRITCADAAATPARWQLVLIGFSNGGRGVLEAIAQLAGPGAAVGLDAVELTRVVLADAAYGRRWLPDIWRRVRALPALVELTVLLQAGGFGRGDAQPGHGNRVRAWAFAQAVRAAEAAEAGAAAAAAAAPAAEATGAAAAGVAEGDLVVGRVRLRRLALDHHAIGDRAHEVIAPAVVTAL